VAVTGAVGMAAGAAGVVGRGSAAALAGATGEGAAGGVAGSSAAAALMAPTPKIKDSTPRESCMRHSFRF
jgi:hypothetical protein